MNNNLNKNISVWRGDSTPPTDYHLWETSDGKIKTKINNEWKQVTSPTDKEHIDRAIYNISTLEVGTDQINYKIDHNNGNYDNISLVHATEEQAGLMNAMQVIQLGSSIKELSISSSSTSISIGWSRNNYDLPISTVWFEAATESHAGPMSAEDKTKLDTNIYDLGTFERSELADQEAATAKIAGNNDIVLIKYKYGAKSGLIIQQVGDFRTLQILLLDGGNQARWIVFSNSSRTNVVGVSRWNKCGITGLGYDSDNHKLNVFFLDDTLPNAGVTLPVAGESKWGLIDKATYDNAVALYTKLNNIKIKSITPANSNVLKSYQLIDSNNNVLGETINIPKDSSIKTVEIADTKATIDSNGNIIKGSGDTALSIVYVLADGSYKIVNASLSKFLEESEFGNGLQVVNHKVSVLKDPTSEDFLKVTDKGISISGVKTAITDETQKYLPLRGGGTLYTNTSPNSIIFNPIDGSIISTSMEDFTRILPGQINLHNSGSSLNMNYQHGFMYNDTNLRDGLFIGSSAQKNGIQFKIATTVNTKFIQISTFIPNRDNYAFRADGSLLDISHFSETLYLNDGFLYTHKSPHTTPEINRLNIGTYGFNIKCGITYNNSYPLESSTNCYTAWATDGKLIDMSSVLYLNPSNEIRIFGNRNSTYIPDIIVDKINLQIATADRVDVKYLYHPGHSDNWESPTTVWTQDGESLNISSFVTINSNNDICVTKYDSSIKTNVQTTFNNIYNKTETNTLLDKKFGYITQNIYSDRILTQFFTNKDNIIQELDHIITPIRTSTLVGLMSPSDVTRINRSIQQMDTLYNRESRSYDILYNTNNMEQSRISIPLVFTPAKEDGLMPYEDKIKLDNFEGALSESDIAALF